MSGIDPRTVKHRHGFTFVEMFIVMLVLGVLAAIAVPKYYSWIQVNRVRSASKTLIADLNYASSMARTTSQSVSLTFDIARNTYTILDVVNPRRPEIPYAVNMGAPPFEVDINRGTTKLTFDKYGNATTDGAWTIQADGVVSAQVTIAANQSNSVLQE